LRFHDLRHEATSRLFEKGLNPVEVATITGHKNPRMLMRPNRSSPLYSVYDVVGRAGSLIAVDAIMSVRTRFCL